MSDDTGRLAWLRWPLILKTALVGIGLGMIYAVATGEFVSGLMLGLFAGVGFGIGRCYDQR